MTDYIPAGITEMEYNGLQELKEITDQMIRSIEQSKHLSPQYLKLVKKSIEGTLELIQEG